MSELSLNQLCTLLRIDETIFDGIVPPTTLRSALNFFSSNLININNVPYHIKTLQTRIDDYPHISDEMIVKISDKYWLMYQIRIQLDRNEKKQKLRKDTIFNIFSLCIDNFHIYKEFDENFISMCKIKIQELLNLNLNKNEPIVLKAKQLRELNTINNL
jgi:hypothetical protein